MSDRIDYKAFVREMLKIYKVSTQITHTLTEHTLFLSREEVFLLSEIRQEDSEKIQANVEKVSSGYPLEYIIQRANFMGNDFYVDENTLIPRFDTEVLVLCAKQHIESTRECIFFDIGSGSGIIPITLNLLTSHILKTIVFDISKEAIGVTRKNQKRLCPNSSFTYLHKDFSFLLESFSSGNFSNQNIVLTANLPYIKQQDFDNMDSSVFSYEPSVALYGGYETGFELYERLIHTLMVIVKQYLFLSFTIFIEIGFDQYTISQEFLNSLGLRFEYFLDTNRIVRVIKITF